MKGMRPLFAILLVSASCSNKSDGELHVDQERGFSIVLPRGWTIKKGNAPHVAVIAGMPETLQAIQVQALEIGRETTAEEQFNEMVLQPAEIGLVTLLEQGSEQVHGEDAFWAITEDSIKGKKIRVLEYRLARGRRVYGIVCTAETEKFDELLPRFRAACRSFQLK